MEQRLHNEIEHGKKIAPNAGMVWSWDTPAGRLRWARRVNMLVSPIKPGMKVLEIGCGTGFFTKELAKTDAEITAIDISPDLLDIAKKDVPAQNVDFRIENAYDMTFADGYFDLIVGSSVLHHLEVGKALIEFRRVLKPDAEMYFTEPNMLNPQICIQKNVPFIKKAMGDSPDETAFIKWILQSQLIRNGYDDIRITPFDFLHPWIPEFVVKPVQPLCTVMEKIPLVRDIAGSLYIRARRSEKHEQESPQTNNPQGYDA